MAYPKTVMIGRSGNNDICLGDSDETISRRHAEIVIARSGAILLTDCSSTCGTHVRSGSSWRAIKQEVVERRQEILLGNANTIMTVDEVLRMGGY